MKGKVEYNGGSLKDIKHSYVIQQDILLRSDPSDIKADSSCAHCSRNPPVRPR
jgi:hypothetical protein